MNYSAVLFDFDYTLADSSQGIVICFRSVLNRYQYNGITDEDIKRTIGKPLEYSFSLLTGITDNNRLASMRNEYVKEADQYMNKNTFLFPDTLSVLLSLKNQGIKTGIVSTKYRYRILDFFSNHLPAGWFDVIIGGEDVSRHKPDPESLNTAIRELNISREQILYIGDSTTDAETALNAGTDFIGITSGITTREELQVYPHVKIIDRLEELIPVSPA